MSTSKPLKKAVLFYDWKKMNASLNCFRHPPPGHALQTACIKKPGLKNQQLTVVILVISTLISLHIDFPTWLCKSPWISGINCLLPHPQHGSLQWPHQVGIPGPTGRQLEREISPWIFIPRTHFGWTSTEISILKLKHLVPIIAEDKARPEQ